MPQGRTGPAQAEGRQIRARQRVLPAAVSVFLCVGCRCVCALISVAARRQSPLILSGLNLHPKGVPLQIRGILTAETWNLNYLPH